MNGSDRTIIAIHVLLLFGQLRAEHGFHFTMKCDLWKCALAWLTTFLRNSNHFSPLLLILSTFLCPLFFLSVIMITFDGILIQFG